MFIYADVTFRSPASSLNIDRAARGGTCKLYTNKTNTFKCDTHTHILLCGIPLLKKKRLNKKNVTNPTERNDRRAYLGRLIKWFCNSRRCSARLRRRVFGCHCDDVCDGGVFAFCARGANRNLSRTRPAAAARAAGYARATSPFSPSRRSLPSERISIVRRCSSISETHSRGKIIALGELRVLRGEHA